jgi:hypothetical protein
MTAPTVALEKSIFVSELVDADPPSATVPDLPEDSEKKATGAALISGVEGSAPVEVPG